MEFLVYPRGLKLKLLRGPHEDYKVIRGPHYDANATIAKLLFISFIFMPAFPLGRVAGAISIEGLGIPHGQQHFQIVLLAPHQDGTKQGRRCSYST